MDRRDELRATRLVGIPTADCKECGSSDAPEQELRDAKGIQHK
jgi:hypothetical protein